LVSPLRREVEVFRFSTARLDLREHATVLRRTVDALGATAGGADRRAWLLTELASPRSVEQQGRTAPTGAEQTLGMMRLVGDLRAEVDRRAFGSFIISGTAGVDDILSAY